LATKVNLKFKGLVTDPNSLGSVPQGALLEAENVVIDRDDILEPRRGFKTYGDAMGVSSNRAKQLLNYKSRLIRHYDDSLEYDSDSSPGTFERYKELAWIYATTGGLTRIGALATFTTTKPHKLQSSDLVIISGADQEEYNGEFEVTVLTDFTFQYTVVGTPVTPATGDPLLECRTAHIEQVDSGNKIRAEEAVNSNFYFTSNTGIRKLDEVNGFITNSGGVKALDLDLSLTASDSPIMPQNSQLGYRIVWGYKDANQNLILGAPSSRATIGLTTESLLLPDFNSLLTKLDVAAGTRLTGTITGNTLDNPTVVTSIGHGLVTGRTIVITGSDSTPSLNGTQVVTVIDADTFTVPVNVTIAGTTGSWETQKLSDIDYNSLAIPLTASASQLNARLKDLAQKLELDLGYVSPSLAKYGRSDAISNIPMGSPGPVVISATGHQLSNGDAIVISDSTCFPSIDGEYIISSVNANDFTIIVNTAITLAGVGTWTSGIARNYPVPNANDPNAFDEQQEFFDEIVDALLDESLVNISQFAQDAAEIQSAAKGRNVTITFTVPDGVTTNYFYQIYRTGASAGSQIDPGDDMGLVFESNPTAAQIKGGTVTVQDQTPDDFRGADLYTNPRQEGILQANEKPPFAKDTAIYKNIGFYANTKTLHKKELALLGTANLAGTKIIIAGVEYSFDVAENIGLGAVQVFTSGTPAQNVDDTARSLVRVINRYAANTQVYAYYISSPDDVPGKILLEARNLDQDKFYILSDSVTVGATNFSPSIAPEAATISTISVADPTVITTTASHGLISGEQIYIAFTNSTPNLSGLYNITRLSPTTFSIPVDVTIAGTTGVWRKALLATSSDNEVIKNRVYYSKQNQQEAVPLLNYFNVGSGDKDIKRIVPLRDSLFVLKDDGIYRIGGETPESLTVSLFDSSVEIKGPETIAVGNNQIYAFSSQGVIVISDTGVQVVSRPLEDQLLNKVPFSNLATTAFAVFYQTDRKYMLWLPEDETDTAARRAYVYNNVTQAWTTWEIQKTCGIVNSKDDKLYLGASDINSLEIERKTFTRNDFADREYALNVTSYSATDKVITLSSVVEVEPGDVLVQELTRTNLYGSYLYKVESKVLSVDPDTSTAVVDSLYDYAVGPITLYKAFQCKVRWAPEDGGNEGEIKQFREATLRFKKSRITEPFLGFSSDLQSGVQEVALKGPGLGLWGYFPWGGVPWGGDTRQKGFRTYIPLGKQRCSLLNCFFRHKAAREDWQVEGLSLVFETSSPRINR
jgi:hypothetical protein